MVRRRERVERHTGAALMEVLLSMAILGATLPALTGAMSASLRAQGRAEERAVAGALAETKLLELRGGVLSRETGEYGGAFGEPYEGYSWRCRIEGADRDGVFARVRLDVFKDERTRAGRIETLIPVKGR